MKNVNFVWFLLFTMIAISEMQAQSPQWTGYVRNYTGVLLSNNEFSIIQNTVNINFEHSKDKVAFKVNPYLYQYTDRELETGLREAYMDIYFNSMDIRIGKQQIIWGKADGVFITDIVSPKDLSEFLLRDFDEIRMGITALKLDYYLGNNTFEFVWVPKFTSTRMPDEGSIWIPKIDFPMVPVYDYSQNQVRSNLKNSEVFTKFSVMTSAVDFEIMAGFMWDDDPALHQSLHTEPSTGQPVLTITPRYHRLSLFGGSFSTTVAGWVLRGEGAYYDGKYFQSVNPVVGVLKKDYLHYMLGLDRSFLDINFSVQFIQQAILDYNDSILQDEQDNTLTLLAKKDFFRETLTLELFSYISLNEGDALIRPKLIYDFSDGFEVLLGSNLFIGDEGRFGQYDNNDMVYVKVRYSF